MTGSELAIRDTAPQRTVLTNEQLKYISGTEFVPPGLRGNMPAILACVATGRELGIGDMASLKAIHIIDGKATFSAELMVQLVRRAGHSITGEVTDGSATVRGKRADTGDEMQSTWTLAMAERAGLLGKSNWKKYPEAMLWARAASQLCRMLFPDCFAGATYTPEELEETEPVAAQPVAARAIASGEMTAAQKKKANVLVGQLRDQQQLLTTEDIYLAAGKSPNDFRDETGLHWSPLRDSLTKKEASVLIDRLEEFAASGRDSLVGVDWAAAAAAPTSEVANQGGLSGEELKFRIQHYEIPADMVKETAHRLFPTVANARDLSDAQRAELWRELESKVPA